jgi:hypothetical protein
MRMRARAHGLVASILIITLAVVLPVHAGAGQTFSATAAVKSPSGSASMPVTIGIDRFVSETDRTAVMDLVKAGNGTATRQALAKMASIGFIELGTRRTPVKYAYSRSTGSGRLITVLTAEPILYVGASRPDAKPKEGFDLALALLVLDGSDKGDGELAPAAKLKVDDKGAIVTEEYGREVVRLTNIAKVK